MIRSMLRLFILIITLGLFLMNVSIYSSPSDGDLNAYARDRGVYQHIKNRLNQIWEFHDIHIAYTALGAPKGWSGWYNGTVKVDGTVTVINADETVDEITLIDEDDMGEYYSNGTFDSILAVLSFRIQMNTDIPGYGHAWGRIHGTEADSGLSFMKDVDASGYLSGDRVQYVDGIHPMDW